MNISNEQALAMTDFSITALRIEADMHGDMAQVALCDAALAGDNEARARCAAAIVAAKQAD